MAERSRARPAGGTNTRISARNRKTILDAAIRVFTEKGYDGASIAEIAAASGLPKANIYYYFGSKETIYRTLITEVLSEWDKALAELTADREPAEALAAYIRAKLDFTRRHAAESRIFANEAVHGGRFLSRADRAHMRAVTAERVAVLEGWMEAGRMDRVDPIHLFVMLWASTQYYADFEILARNALGPGKITPADYDQAAETITRIVLKGCGLAG
ncbi:MAG: TetR family transcriptional regulator C-terminal domain-containing protein [Bauldia sp.]|nr:TetR family transcriptional regulator C-terminal domain-containing protein [Bauldia sp.]